MKLAGFFLMPAGWFIAVSAIGLLHTLPSQTAFVLTGFVIEAMGLVFVARQQRSQRRARGGH